MGAAPHPHAARKGEHYGKQQQEHAKLGLLKLLSAEEWIRWGNRRRTRVFLLDALELTAVEVGLEVSSLQAVLCVGERL